MTRPATTPIELASGHLRLLLEVADGRVGFVTEIDDDGRRMPAASVPNVLLGGLGLRAATVAVEGDGLRMAGGGAGPGSDVAEPDRPWTATITPCTEDGFTFEVTVDLTVPTAEPPAIELWLGPLSTIADRQSLTWRRSFVGGPVRNTQGLPGNTVPAAYLYDPATGVETILHVDAGAIAWAPRRLLDLELRELFDYERCRYGLGLVPARRFQVQPGVQRFRWRFWQRRAGIAPDGWQASARLVDVLATGLDAPGRLPGEPHPWERVAAGVVGDLLDADQVQVSVPAGAAAALGLRAYVRDAPAWYPPAAEQFELMTVADVVPPLLLYLRLHPDEGAATLAVELRETLHRFHRPEARYVSNRFPTDGVEPVTDTWYLFLNGLVKLPWVALIDGDEGLGRIALDGLGGATDLAVASEIRLPLFAAFRAGAIPRPVGPAPNPSVAGLLAYAALLGVALGGPDGRELARRLLLGLRREPVALAYHEPLQLGFAAASAARLADAGEPGMAALADELVRAQLRQLYWDEDPAAERDGYRVRGMFEACASLLYPALKENVEAILPWTVLLRSGRGPTKLLLDVMNLIRVHSLDFFDPFLPRPRGGPAPWIPYENLGTTELPGTGSIGREVYGAGEGIWAYLLFEALARADDPAILVVYTDLLEPATMRAFPPPRRRFLVYNPTRERRAFSLAHRHLTGASYRLSTSDRAVDPNTLLGGVPVALEPRSFLVVDVEEIP